MSNPITALLSQVVLDGNNFQKWKSNLNIVLVSESIRFVLTEAKPHIPSNNTSKEGKEAYTRRITSNNKAIAYMLASMIDTLRTKLEKLETAFEILNSV